MQAYIYTLNQTAPRICVLTKDVQAVAAATNGKPFSNTVTTDTLLNEEEIFNLTRQLEPSVTISVSSFAIRTANYWSILAKEYPTKTLAELKELGF